MAADKAREIWEATKLREAAKLRGAALQLREAIASLTSLNMAGSASAQEPYDVAAHGLEVEATMAAEAVREMREAADSVRLDVNDDLPQHLAMDQNVQVEGEPLNATTALNSAPLQNNNDSISKLIAMQKSVLAMLPSETKKRHRSTAVVDMQSSPTTICPTQKRRKRPGSKKSLVWNHFSTGLRGKDPIASCKYCGQVYACDKSTHGTSTLWKHLRFLCPKDPLKDQDMKRKNPGTPKQSYSVEDCRNALAEMVIIDEMPFKAVEGEGFRRYSKVLQPRFDPPSRVTVARDCMKRYYEEKPNFKKIMKNQRICLTTDTWTSKQNLCYMSLTAHWIDDEWKLQKRILNFCSVNDHKGETLGRRVEECLLEWGVDRIFTITVDNASSNNRLIQYMKGVCKDWKEVVLRNEFMHVRCCCHIVNIGVKSGLQEYNGSIDKIRLAVKFVRSSPSRLKIFKKCAELEKISSKSYLTLDLETRWNATYLMLENAEKFEKAFARMEKTCKQFRDFFGDLGPPNESDWDIARRIICFLKLFEKVTSHLSGSLYVTSSIAFHDIMLMRAILDELAAGEDPTLASMAYHMKLKFQKYWEEDGNISYLLFIAVILDPRYKLQYLTFCLELLYGAARGKEINDKVESALAELFGSYVQTFNASSCSNKGLTPTPIHLTVDEEDEENPWDMLASLFEQRMEEIESEPNDSELTRYLADKREKRTKEFDILNYWRVNSSKYPVLSLMAKDVLAVPASTVPSESAFSTGGRIIDPLRCSLSTSTVEALICAQSWMQTSSNKVSLREAAEEVQTYEDIREELVSKDFTESQHHTDFTEFEA